MKPFSRSRRKTDQRKRVCFKPFLEQLEDRTLLSIVNWIGGSGDFGDAKHWLDATTGTNHVPTASDDAVIKTAGITVTHASGSDSVTSLTATGNTFAMSGGFLSIATASAVNDLGFTGGTIDGAGDLTVAGKGTWDGGSMTGSGKTIVAAAAQLTIQVGDHGMGRLIDSTAGPLNWVSGTVHGDWTNVGQLNISGDANKFLNSGTLTRTSGTTVWSGAGNLVVHDGTIVNQAQATFTVQNDAQYRWDGRGPGAEFINSGTFRKVAGTGTTSLAANGTYFENTGLVDVQSGTLALGSSTDHGGSGGTFHQVAGAVLAFAAGTYLFKPGASLTGPGLVRFDGATVTVASPLTLPDNVSLEAGQLNVAAPLSMPIHFAFTGGTLNATAALTLPGPLTQSGGTLTGTADVTITGAFSWTGGVMSGTGRTVVASTGTLTIQGQGDHVDNRFIDSTAGPLNWVDGSLSGSFSNAGVLNISGSTRKVLDGTLTKTAGMTVWTDTGVLRIADGAEFDNQLGAIFEARNDASINDGQFSGEHGTFNNEGIFRKVASSGTTVLANRLTFNNRGTVEVQTGTLQVGVGDGSMGSNSGTFHTLPGATLIFSGQGYTLQAGTNFNNAGVVHFAGGTVTVASALSLPGNMLLDGGTLTGTADVTITGAFTWVTPGDMTGLGAIIVASGAQLFLLGRDLSITRPVVNKGTLRRQAGSGTSTFVSGLSNSGVVDVQSGTIALPGSFSNTAGLTIGAAGRLSVGGDFTQSATASTDIDIGGDPNSGLFGKLSITHLANLAGTLNIGLSNGYTPSVGQAYPIITYANHGGTFSTINGLRLGRTTVFTADVADIQLVLHCVVSAADLATVSITHPSTGVLGQNTTISYTVRNVSSTTAVGPWYDSVYLSAADTLTPDAVLIGRVQHVGDVAGGGSYSESLTAPLPAVIDGPYHIIVVADSRGFVPDANRANNILVSTDLIQVAVPELRLGRPVSGTIANGQDIYYRLDLSPGQSVLVSPTFAAANEAELHESYHAIPDRTSPGGNLVNPGSSLGGGLTASSQSILFSDLPGGSYYLLLHGREGAGNGQSFSLLAQALPLSIASISPDHGSNEGQATVTLKGSLFTPTTTASLVSSGGQVIPAKVVRFEGDSTLTATFDLLRLAAGPYDVMVKDTKNGATARLAEAFTVNSTAPGQIKFDLHGPSVIRPYQPGTYIVLEYTNTGDTDLPAPLVTVQAQNALLGDPIQNGLPQLNLPLVFGPPSASGGGGGGGGASEVIPPILFRPQGSPSVELLANDPASSGGILPPGYHGFFTIPFTPTVFGAHVTSTFSLLVPPADDTSFDWSSQKDALRPPTIPADAWDAIFANFVARVGTTVGQYQQILQEDASYLSQVGETVTNASQLLAFELQQDGDSLPQPTLATAVDASAPAPGLPLTFGRVFVQSIAGRYQLGPLGRGWADTWDTTATADSSGNVTIQGAGTVRFFTKQPGGFYVAAPGDHGTLTLQNGVYQLREKDGTLDVFQSDGRLSYVQDTNGNRITATYSNGLLTKLTHSDGQSFTLSYDTHGRISQLTDEAGRITTYSYDTSGEHLLSVTGPGGTTSYTYDLGSNIDRTHALLSITNPDGTHLFFDYDNQGRLIGQHKDGGAEAITYAYDVGPGGFRTIDANNASTTSLLNDAGQTARIIDPLGRVTRFGYDANFNLVQVVAPGGITSTYKYDGQGNVIQQVDPLGNTVQMTYDPNFNRLLSLRDPRGNTMGYSYDPQGNLRSITYPNGAAEQFSYDPLGDLTETVNRRNDAILYTRDSRGLLTRKDLADGSHTDFTYDDRGNMLTATDATGITKMEYDSADRLTKITYPGGRFLHFTYDAGGRRTQMVDQSGFTVNYQYDSAGRLGGLTDGKGASIVSYKYDAVGRLARKDMGNGTFTTYQYDAAGQLLHLVNHAPDGSVNSRFDYTYDDLGRRTSMTTLDGTTKYGYDADGQLTSVMLPGGRTIQYVYDPAGNRVSVTDNGVTTNYTTNNLNQYTTVGTAHLGYDADGNLISQVDGSNSTTYIYDDENHVVSAATPQGTWTYHYDPFGNRTATTHNGQQTQYLLDPTGLVDVVGEYGSGGNLVAHYTQGLGLTSRVDATGVAAYYDFDAIGSTVAFTDTSGKVVNSYSYLPFGEQLTASGSSTTPFGFIGQLGVMQEGNGLQLMRARFYAPNLGKFVEKDPLGIVIPNLYNYADNNPIRFLDPLGLSLEGFARGLQKQANALANAANNAEDDSIRNAATDQYNQAGQEVAHNAPSAVLELFFVHLISELGGDFGHLLELAHVLHLAHSVNLPGVNAATVTSEQRTPGDPNDITGPAGFGPNGFLPPTQTLPYTIQFENKPDATAPASVVTVTEKLDPNLDWSTFQLGDFGFGGLDVVVPAGRSSYSVRLDLRQSLGVFVGVTAGIDLNTGVATWTFTSIDPKTLDVPSDILSGFLPPDQNPPDGEAFINYTIQPKATDTTGTQINAKATVIFDAGLPDQSSLDTAPIFNTVDAAPPTSSVNPLPDFTSTPSFTVSWSGQDDPGGSGIAFFDIYVSTDGGPFQPFLLDTTKTSATFTGDFGHTYGFYSIATDNVGNVEATPAEAQATTFVGLPSPPPPVSMPTSRVNPLPPIEFSPIFTVSWFGSDSGGPGIAYFDIYVSDNGAPFTLWQSHTTHTEASYYGVNGHSYGFYSVATDANGLMQPTPTQAQAQTFVFVPPPPSPPPSPPPNPTPPSSSVNPLPATEASPRFTVSWSGSDPGGPGIAFFSIYVSIDGGVFTPWLTDTTQTSATYTGQTGHSYGFYSIATDTHGLSQPTPTGAQALTVVSLPPTPPTSSVNPLPATESSPSFTVSWSGSDPGGPGIAYFSIYVSIDGGAFAPWLTATTQTTATYTGQTGHGYGFYSVAADTHGLSQPTPAGAQATTFVPSPPPPPPSAPPSPPTSPPSSLPSSPLPRPISLAAALAEGIQALELGIAIEPALPQIFGGAGSMTQAADLFFAALGLLGDELSLFNDVVTGLEAPLLGLSAAQTDALAAGIDRLVSDTHANPLVRRVGLL